MKETHFFSELGNWIFCSQRHCLSSDDSHNSQQLLRKTWSVLVSLGCLGVPVTTLYQLRRDVSGEKLARMSTHDIRTAVSQSSTSSYSWGARPFLTLSVGLPQVQEKVCKMFRQNTRKSKCVAEKVCKMFRQNTRKSKCVAILFAEPFGVLFLLSCHRLPHLLPVHCLFEQASHHSSALHCQLAHPSPPADGRGQLWRCQAHIILFLCVCLQSLHVSPLQEKGRKSSWCHVRNYASRNRGLWWWSARCATLDLCTVFTAHTVSQHNSFSSDSCRSVCFNCIDSILKKF